MKPTFYTAPLRLSLVCVHAIDSGSPSELFHYQYQLNNMCAKIFLLNIGDIYECLQKRKEKGRTRKFIF